MDERNNDMHYYFVDVLRCIATILITNSHYNAIWPIAALATGGSLGNTLFFAISGYCLSNTQNTNFVEWMKKRILRIYPAVWIVTVIEFVFLTPSIHSIWDGVTYFVYPTQFWFVSAIVLFYGLFFIIDKHFAKYVDRIIIANVILYLFFYIFMVDKNTWSIEGTGFFKWIFYFEVMLVAYSYKKGVLRFSEVTPLKASIRLFIVLVVYFGFKFIISKSSFLLKFQFIVHLISIVFLKTSFEWGMSLESFLKKKKDKTWLKILSRIGRITLEIYLVQTFLIRAFCGYVFPVNLIVVTVSILVCAEALHYMVILSLSRMKGKKGNEVRG